MRPCGGKSRKKSFVTAPMLGTTDKFFVATTKNFAAATTRFVDWTKHFVFLTKCFCYPYFNKWFCYKTKLLESGGSREFGFASTGLRPHSSTTRSLADSHDVTKSIPYAWKIGRIWLGKYLHSYTNDTFVGEDVARWYYSIQCAETLTESCMTFACPPKVWWIES